MLCPKCGAQLSDSAVICRACGAMLPEGKTYMKDELGMSDEEVEKMAWLGISGIANVLCWRRQQRHSRCRRRRRRSCW